MGETLVMSPPSQKRAQLLVCRSSGTIERKRTQGNPQKSLMNHDERYANTVKEKPQTQTTTKKH